MAWCCGHGWRPIHGMAAAPLGAWYGRRMATVVLDEERESTAAGLFDPGEPTEALVVRVWFFSVVWLCAARTVLMLAQRWSRVSRRPLARHRR